MIRIKGESSPSLLTLGCLEALKNNEKLIVPDDIGNKIKILSQVYDRNIRIELSYGTGYLNGKMILNEIKENENSWILHYCSDDFDRLKFAKGEYQPKQSCLEFSLFGHVSSLYDYVDYKKKLSIPFDMTSGTHVHDFECDEIKTSYVINFGEGCYFHDNTLYQHVRDVVLIVWKYHRCDFEYEIDVEIYNVMRKQMQIICKKYGNVGAWCKERIRRKKWNSKKYHPYMRGFLKARLNMELSAVKRNAQCSLFQWISNNYQNSEGLFDKFLKNRSHIPDFHVLKKKNVKKVIDETVTWLKAKCIKCSRDRKKGKVMCNFHCIGLHDDETNLD